jgi:hypothetical protein
MTIPATCPACREHYQLAEELAGKFVRCRKCQETFAVPAAAPPEPLREREEEEPPRPRERDRYRERDREDDLDRDRERRPSRRERYDEPASSSNAMIFWVMGALGLGLLVLVGVCGGIIWSVSNSAGRAVDQTVDNIKAQHAQAMQQQQQMRPPMPQQPGIQNVDQALTALRSPDPEQRRRGVDWLIFHQPDPDPNRRRQVVDALEPLTRDQDFGVRTWATHARAIWNR